MALHDETRIPLKWVFALLAGCAVSLGVMVGVGMYAGALDARGQSTSVRVDKLEVAVDAIVSVDRRLARIEGAMGVKAPPEERAPAALHDH